MDIVALAVLMLGDFDFIGRHELNMAYEQSWSKFNRLGYYSALPKLTHCHQRLFRGAASAYQQAARRQDCTVAEWLHGYFQRHGIDGQRFAPINLTPVEPMPAAPVDDLCRLTEAAARLAETADRIAPRAYVRACPEACGRPRGRLPPAKPRAATLRTPPATTGNQPCSDGAGQRSRLIV